jgi:hypothetical protein
MKSLELGLDAPLDLSVGIIVSRKLADVVLWSVRGFPDMASWPESFRSTTEL